MGGSSIKRSVQVQQVVIDSADRDSNLYPLPTNFTMRLPETLRNVFAVRLLKTEYYNSSNTTTEILVGDTSIPITTLAPSGNYMYLNNYRLLWRDAKKDSVNIFARLGMGSDVYPHSENLFKDPYTYILNPVEPKFDRLDIKLYQSDNTVSQQPDLRFVMLLAIYSLPT